MDLIFLSAFTVEHITCSVLRLILSCHPHDKCMLLTYYMFPSHHNQISMYVQSRAEQNSTVQSKSVSSVNKAICKNYSSKFIQSHKKSRNFFYWVQKYHRFWNQLKWACWNGDVCVCFSSKKQNKILNRTLYFTRFSVPKCKQLHLKMPKAKIITFQTDINWKISVRAWLIFFFPCSVRVFFLLTYFVFICLLYI